MHEETRKQNAILQQIDDGVGHLMMGARVSWSFPLHDHSCRANTKEGREGSRLACSCEPRIPQLGQDRKACCGNASTLYLAGPD